MKLTKIEMLAVSGALLAIISCLFMMGGLSNAAWLLAIISFLITGFSYLAEKCSWLKKK